jgi:hypothetical protein
MPSERVRAAVRAAERGSARVDRIGRVCSMVVAALPVDGVGLSVTGGTGQHNRVAATDEVSGRIEDLQVLLGQGPCVDAVTTGAPVLVADLGEPGVLSRWPAFVPAVATIGVRASFAVPLLVGDLRIGAMDLYRRATGPLQPEQVAHAEDLASAAVEVLLRLQIEGPGATDGTFPAGWAATSVVHQATGMVMVQLGVEASSAFAALRARAYREGMTLQELAREVLDRRQRLDDSGV